jgi:hypothetical protein
MTEEKKITLDPGNWDSPTDEDLFGRGSFVDTIVKTIESADEGFNFGISARWGEGKSSILKQLKPKLIEKGYKVLEFQPWKYSQDSISVKRKFIIDINNQLGKPQEVTEFYQSTEKETTIPFKKKAVTLLKKVGYWLLTSVVVSILFILLLRGIKMLFKLNFSVTDTFLHNIFIPGLVGLIPIINEVLAITLKQAVPKVESAEQFEEKFNEAVKEIMKEEPKGIIIFVDDLDRCSHKEVEQVLTALFTFFNNKHCTYIITADHTVIRRYIGEFLGLDTEYNDQGGIDMVKTEEVRRREATEYLKKIFQINFILPKVDPNLLEVWIVNLIESNPIITIINPYAKTYLVNLIRNNFESNPRKIKHFIRTLAFQLDIIDEKIKQITDPNSKEKKNLQIIKDCPELLAKILIIQDKFPDFYEQLISQPILIKKHELGEISKSPDLQALIAQEPKFFNSITRTENKSVDPYYFLYFSGSTGYAEPQIVDPAQIQSFSKAADFESLVKIISGLTDEPRNEQIETIKNELNAPDIQPPEKINVIRSLFYVVGLVEEPRLRKRQIEDLLNLSQQYGEEFKSVQSVEIAKIAPHIDYALANKILTDAAFTDSNLKVQVLNGLFEARDDLELEVTELLVNSLSGHLLGSAEDFTMAFGLLKGLEEKHITGNNILKEKVLEVLTARSPAEREMILDFIVKNNLDVQNKARKILIDQAKSDELEKVLFVINHLPEPVLKLMQVTDLTKALSERVVKSTPANIEQILAAVSNQVVLDKFGEHLEKIVVAIADGVKGDKERALYVSSKISQLLSWSKDKKSLVEILLAGVAQQPVDVTQSIINNLWANKESWINERGSKQAFNKKIGAMKKIATDQALKDRIQTIQNEITPPKPKV